MRQNTLYEILNSDSVFPRRYLRTYLLNTARSQKSRGPSHPTLSIEQPPPITIFPLVRFPTLPRRSPTPIQTTSKPHPENQIPNSSFPIPHLQYPEPIAINHNHNPHSSQKPKCICVISLLSKTTDTHLRYQSPLRKRTDRSAYSRYTKPALRNRVTSHIT